MNPYILLRGVSKTYDGTLCSPHKLSIKLDENNPFILLCGDNGVGKSTIFNIIIGEEQKTYGEIEMSDIQDVSMLFQSDGLLPNLTVLDNLKLVSNSDQVISDTILKYGLSIKHLYTFAKELSGGEERRVQLARLSLSNRSIWMLDEPTSHTDMKFKKSLLDSLKTHVNNGGLCMLVTHDEDFLRDITKELKTKIEEITVYKRET